MALARCAPLDAAAARGWIALEQPRRRVVLLLAKRPRAAWAELSDIGAVLDPWRVLAARWRSRGTRAVRRRDLAGLFVRPRHGAAAHHRPHPRPGRPATTRPTGAHAPVEALESGPVSDEAQDLNVLSASRGRRGRRATRGCSPSRWPPSSPPSPAAAAVAASPSGSTTGLTGGELVGRAGRRRARSGTPGWTAGTARGSGRAGEQGPHLAVLAGAGLGGRAPARCSSPPAPRRARSSPLLVGLALPLATLTAYLGARVVTHSRWPRALAALAWSTTAVRGHRRRRRPPRRGRRRHAAPARRGRVRPRRPPRERHHRHRGDGPRRRPSSAPSSPALLVVTAWSPRWSLVVLGPGWARAARPGPAGPAAGRCMGPWVAALVASPAPAADRPGPGGLGRPQAPPWQIALAAPGRPRVATPCCSPRRWSSPGSLGLLRGGRRSAAAPRPGVVALLGLAARVAAPRISLGAVPEGLPERRASRSRPGPAPACCSTPSRSSPPPCSVPTGCPCAARAVAGRPWPAGPSPPRVIVAVLVECGVDGLAGDRRGAVGVVRPAAGRGHRPGRGRARPTACCCSTPEGDRLTYQLLGREVGDVARTLPAPSGRPARRAALATGGGSLFEQGGSPGALTPAADLADPGRRLRRTARRGDRPRDPHPRRDGRALSRLGEHDGVIFWRVLPAAAGLPTTPSPRRGPESSPPRARRRST